MPPRTKKEPLPKVGDQKRLVYFVSIDSYVEGHGWRVSVVEEGKGGHCPTGNWPCDYSKGHSMPIFWDVPYEEAQKLAERQNALMEIDGLTAALIVAQSMALPMPRGKAPR